MTDDARPWTPWSRGRDTTNSTFWQPPLAPVQPSRPRRVVRAVAHACELHDAVLYSRRRDQPAARARQVACYILRTYCGMSLPEIGRVVKRDHTTVLHGCRVIGRLMRDGTIEGRWLEDIARTAGVLD